MFRAWFRRFGANENGLARCIAGAALGTFGPFAILAATGCSSSTAQTPAIAPSPPSSPASRAASAPLPADIVERSALPLHAVAGAELIAEPELWERMSRSRAVCLGERHDSPQHHFAQRRAIEELARRGAAPERPLAVGFEMFQRPYQAALSSYVAGELPEDQFLIASEYRQRWGFDFALYRPLLEVARAQRLPALALNAPRELTRKIGRSGLAALAAAERQQLPELDLQDSEHRSYFDAAMADHPMPAGGPRLDDMYAVQVVWDETMADTAARWLESAGDGAQLVVLAGAGHCHQRAIPARLSRRIGAPVLSVSAVLASELDAFRDRDRYDWLLVLEDERASGSSAQRPL